MIDILKDQVTDIVTGGDDREPLPARMQMPRTQMPRMLERKNACGSHRGGGGGSRGSGFPFFGGVVPPPLFAIGPPTLVSASIQKQSNTFYMTKVNCRRDVKNITKNW